MTYIRVLEVKTLENLSLKYNIFEEKNQHIFRSKKAFNAYLKDFIPKHRITNNKLGDKMLIYQFKDERKHTLETKKVIILKESQ